MKYSRFDELAALVKAKLITKRPHPSLPLDVYNYTVGAQFTPIVEWTEAMKDCRGLILDRSGEIVGRPFRKFWNYEQVLADIPGEPFTVWEKMDGSLGIICYCAGERVVATRGSFESEQAVWLKEWLDRRQPDFYPSGETWLVEIVYPGNRIVVDYRDTSEPFLLSVMSPDGVDLWNLFDNTTRFRKAKRYDSLKDFSQINSSPEFTGGEGFVVQWASGFRTKLKLEEYKRLHRLITQCSTRTIWEMLRSGSDTRELLDRVPSEFGEWVVSQIHSLSDAHQNIRIGALAAMEEAPPRDPRKDFAMWAKQKPWPGLLFSLLDGKDITDSIWKMVEPKWATPFRKDIDA